MKINIQQADVVSRNGKLYSEECCRKIAEQFAALPECSVMGQLDGRDSSLTKFAEISHVVKNLHFDEKDKTIKAEIEPLQTPCGKILKNLLDNNVAVSFGLYGVGDCKNGYIDAKSYKFISVDAFAP